MSGLNRKYKSINKSELFEIPENSRPAEVIQFSSFFVLKENIKK
jgi:hypothetical protein